MEVNLLDETYFKKYTEFLLDDKNSLFYYSIKYKNFLEILLSCESEYLIALENDSIQGLLPLMKTKGKFGVVYNSLPFYGSNGGIMASNKLAFDLLLKEYNFKINNPEVGASTLVTNPITQNDYSRIEHNEKDIRIGQFTNIEYQNNSEISLMQSYHYKTRNMIRKAIKSNVTVEPDNTQLEFLKTTHQENMNAIGVMAKSENFFNLLPKYFDKDHDYKIYIAKKDDQIIAALLVFYFNKTIEYFTPVILKAFRSYQPLSLLIYQVMIDGAKEGCKFWNWGGSKMVQDSVYKFKKRWNTLDKKYFYYIKINNPEIYRSSKEELLEEYPNFFVIPFNKLKE